MAKKLPDAKVVELAERYKQHRAQEAAESAAADELKLELLDELDRRGVASIDTPALTVTKKQQTKRWVDAVVARARLSPPMFNKVAVQSVDRAAFELLVQVGKIPQDVAVDCRQEKKTAAYIDVTLKGDVAQAA